MNREVLTYSAIKLFQGCRHKYNLRMNEGLAYLTQDDNLYLGSVWHLFQEIWYGGGVCELVSLSIRAFPVGRQVQGRNAIGICVTPCSEDTSIDAQMMDFKRELIEFPAVVASYG